jgi:hypothetical protein
LEVVVYKVDRLTRSHPEKKNEEKNKEIPVSDPMTNANSTA